MTTQETGVTDRGQNGIVETRLALTIRSILQGLDRSLACSVLGVPKPITVQELIHTVVARKNVHTEAARDRLPAFGSKIGIDLKENSAIDEIRSVVENDEDLVA